MHFTLVFESHESEDSSYGMVFIPCPVWVQGKTELVNLHRDHPNYDRGDLQPLLERIDPLYQSDGLPHVVCVVHPNGHGTQSDLENLMADLEDSPFQFTLVDIAAREA